MKLLILGGINFLGRELLKQAQEQNHDITLISLDSPQNKQNVNWLKVDRTNFVEMRKALQDLNFDAVIDNIAYNAANVRVLLDSLQGRATRYVMTSTVDTYNNKKIKKVDEILDNNLVMEDYSGDKSWLSYGVHKRAAEIILRNDTTIKEKVIIRPCVVTGPYDGIHHFGVPRSLIWPSKIIDNEPLLLYKNDFNLFSLIDVKDVAAAQLLVAQHPDAANQVFNVSPDFLWNAEKLVDKLIYYTGSKSKIAARVSMKMLSDNNVIPLETNKMLPHAYGGNKIHILPAFDNSRLKKLGWKCSDEKDTLLSLFENTAKIQEVREKFSELRQKEIEYAKTFRDESHTFTPGFCTAELSSVAIGTFRGEENDETDKIYDTAIRHAITNGINVIDTAINYRNSRSEKVIGSILKEIPRSSFYIITKGGYLGKSYLWPLHNENEAKINHSIRPGYINHTFNTSLANLQLQTLDMYFIHNPENALGYFSQDEFYHTLLQNFVQFEHDIWKGRLKGYGLATWDGLICNNTNPKYINLSRVLEMAKLAGGDNHHFSGIEIPLNVKKHEGYTNLNQPWQGEMLSVIDVARKNNIKIFTSASAMYGEDDDFCRSFYNFDYDLTTAQKSLLFAKSVPGVTSAIVGTRQIENINQASIVDQHKKLSGKKLEFIKRQCLFRKIKQF